jgi:dipeptidyl aminopeptidase/acylaminoacyl peptidase
VTRTCWIVASFAVLASASVSAQDAPGEALPVSSYARAEALDRPSAKALVKNLAVVPHWIGASDDFWYRKETASGARFVIVDARSGKSRAAFDHGAIAAAIARSSGKAADADHLPFERMELSADRGSMIVSVESGKYRCTLVPVRCQSTEPPPALLGGIPSPDGRWAVLGRGANLFLHDLSTGVERALTEDGVPNFGYGIYSDGWKAEFVSRERSRDAGAPQAPMETSWSPDSRWILAPRVDQRHVEEYPLLETVPRDGSFRPKAHGIRLPLMGDRPPTLEWFVIDRESGARRRLEFPYAQLLDVQQDMLAIRRTWWSADNRHLYAVAFGAEMRSAWFFDADVATGAVRTVIHEELLPRTDLNSTSYNPPNVWVTRDGGEVIWFSQRDGWGHLYRYDGKSGALLNRITEGSWLVRDIVAVDERARRIYFTGGGREGGNPYYRYLYRVGFDGKGLTLLSPEPADHMISSPYNDVLAIDGGGSYDVLSPSGRYVVYNHSTPARPTESVIRATASGALVGTFERADASALFAAGFEPPEEVVLKAADGTTDLWCVLYRPHGLRAERRYPVLDVEYASPLTAVVPRNFEMAILGPSSPSAPSSYAALGMAVVIVDGRGTTFRSRDFAHSIFGRLNINGLDDHVAAIRQLGAIHPWLDLDRVGVIGRSYGGWSAFRALLEFPELFKVGVAGAAPGSMHNLYLDYHWSAMHGPPVYADGSARRGSPTEVPSNWNVLDGRQQADRLKGKLLVILGELDENVPIGSTMQFLDALQKADKDFDLIYLADQDHYFTGNPYVTRRVWDYLVRNLVGATPPAYRVTDRR